MDAILYSKKKYSKVETDYFDGGIYRKYLNDKLNVVETHDRDDDRSGYVSVSFGDSHMAVTIGEYESNFGHFSSLNEYIDEIVGLEERVGRLEGENKEMRNRMDEMSDRLVALEYAPGGIKYKEAERDFYFKAK